VNRTEVASHITESGIKQFDYLEANNDVLWAVRNDGKLTGMTASSTESISGWHLHNTDGNFISICSLTRPSKEAQLWACVSRTVNGATQYNVEFMTDTPTYPQIEDYFSEDEVEATDKLAWLNMMYEAQRQYIHLDSALTYDGSEFATVTMTPGAVSGTGVTFTAGGAVFTASMVGRQIVRKSITGYETGVAEITGYTSSTVVTCTILETFNSTSVIPIDEWYLTTDAVTDALERQTEAVDKLREAEEKAQEARTGVKPAAATAAETEVGVTPPPKATGGLYGSFMEAVRALHPNSKALNSATPVTQAKKDFPKLYADYKAKGLAMAQGGIITKPTQVLAGENGKEAIIPLDKLQSGMTVNVTINAGMGADAATIGDEIVNVLQRYNRRNGALPLKVA